MKLTIAVSNIVGMNLIVAGTRSVRPLIVEVEYVDSLVPVCQITADIEVTMGSHAAKVILAGIFQHTGIGHPFDDRILAILARCCHY